jgi:long-chain acyl-CoA synthetase
VLEKIQAKALATRGALGSVGQGVFDWAFGIGQEVAELERAGGSPTGWLSARHRLADRLVLRKVRQKLGGSIKLVVSGGAPLAPHLSEWFHAAGILVVEGYGLTETSAPATTNTPDNYRFGTVGQAIPGTDIRIADDGEIEIKGPGVTTGYYRDEDATSAAFTNDGYFRSGDIGNLDPEGYLRITGRKKNIIITAGGKNIGPGRIENLLKEHLLVGQAMVYGDRKPYLVCLLALDPEDAPAWASAEGIESDDLGELSRHPRVVAALTDHVEEVNAQLASYETLKHFEVTEVPFLPENGYLTPTLKLKRRAILGDFGSQIEALYSRT